MLGLGSWFKDFSELSIESSTLRDLGEASSLALYSLIAAASPLGLPTALRLPAFLASIAFLRAASSSFCLSSASISPIK